MDSAVTPQAQTDVRTSDIELPVMIDDLAIDGTPPSVGDSVDLQVGGNVTRIVNDIVWVQPDTINHKPIPTTPMERNDGMDELDRQYNMSQQTKGGSNAQQGY